MSKAGRVKKCPQCGFKDELVVGAMCLNCGWNVDITAMFPRAFDDIEDRELAEAESEASDEEL